MPIPELIPPNPLAIGQVFAYNFNTGFAARESAHHFGAWPVELDNLIGELDHAQCDA